MKRGIIILTIFTLIFLIGCEKTNIQGAIIGLEDTIDSLEYEKNYENTEKEEKAEDLIEYMKKSTEINQDFIRVGTFYGEFETSSTGKDALKEKTRALFQKKIFTPEVEADRKQGQRHTYENKEE
jgi:hypothetical protein